MPSRVRFPAPPPRCLGSTTEFSASSPPAPRGTRVAGESCRSMTSSASATLALWRLRPASSPKSKRVVSPLAGRHARAGHVACARDTLDPGIGTGMPFDAVRTDRIGRLRDPSRIAVPAADSAALQRLRVVLLLSATPRTGRDARLLARRVARCGLRLPDCEHRPGDGAGTALRLPVVRGTARASRCDLPRGLRARGVRGLPRRNRRAACYARRRRKPSGKVPSPRRRALPGSGIGVTKTSKSSPSSVSSSARRRRRPWTCSMRLAMLHSAHPRAIRAPARGSESRSDARDRVARRRCASATRT